MRFCKRSIKRLKSKKMVETMKRIFLYILAFFLLPFYPILKGIRKMGDKLQLSEKIVVVTRNQNKRRVFIN